MDDRVRVYALDCAAFSDEALFQKYYALQPLWRRQKIDAMRRRSDKQLSLGAGVALRCALPDADLDAYVPGQNGKPYLRDAGRFFSLSHAGQYAVCAAGPKELGCDIECVRPVHPQLADRFFHPEETALLDAQPDAQSRERLFFRLWTLKESFLKATGNGFSQSLGSFSIVWNNGVPVLLGQEDKWAFREYPAPEGYACAVCAPAGCDFENGITYIRL